LNDIEFDIKTESNLDIDNDNNLEIKIDETTIEDKVNYEQEIEIIDNDNNL